MTELGLINGSPIKRIGTIMWEVYCSWKLVFTFRQLFPGDECKTSVGRYLWPSAGVDVLFGPPREKPSEDLASEPSETKSSAPFISSRIY